MLVATVDRGERGGEAGAGCGTRSVARPVPPTTTSRWPSPSTSPRPSASTTPVPTVPPVVRVPSFAMLEPARAVRAAEHELEVAVAVQVAERDSAAALAQLRAAVKTPRPSLRYSQLWSAAVPVITSRSPSSSTSPRVIAVTSCVRSPNVRPRDAVERVAGAVVEVQDQALGVGAADQVLAAVAVDVAERDDVARGGRRAELQLRRHGRVRRVDHEPQLPPSVTPGMLTATVPPTSPARPARVDDEEARAAAERDEVRGAVAERGVDVGALSTRTTFVVPDRGLLERERGRDPLAAKASSTLSPETRRNGWRAAASDTVVPPTVTCSLTRGARAC